MIKNNFLKNINTTSVMGVIFGGFIFVPNKLKPYLLVLLIFFTLLNKIKPKLLDFFCKVLPISFLFILYSFSLIYSDNIKEGGILVFRMLPLLIVPISFFYMDRSVSKIFFDFFIKSFIISLSFYSVLIFFYLNHLGCFTQDSSFGYGYSKITNDFYGINEHPIYISTYFSVGLLMLLKNPFKFKSISIILFICIFFGLIILTRKGAMLGFLFCFIIYILKYKVNFWLLLVFCSSFITIIINFNEINKRFFEVFSHSNITENAQTSSGIRIIIWKNALELISKNETFFGNGAGNVQPLLNNLYLDQGHKNLSEGNYNAHNQFLQVGLTTGLIGLIVFIISNLFFMIHNFKNNKNQSLLYVLFIIIFTTESFLERQNGLIFFALISSMITFNFDEK